MHKGRTAAGVYKSMRVKQWVKNVLVLAVPVLSGKILTWDGAWRSALGVLAYSLAASGAYLLNDAWDVERDRNHPTKRTRPIASGVVSLTVARSSGAVLITLALLLSAGARIEFLWVLAAYVLHTFAYSLWLKHVPTVELVALSSGFVLRTVAGGVLVGAAISTWFFAIVAGGALLLACGKRLAEHRHGASTRPVLAEYTETYLVIVLGAAAAVAVMSYLLWVFHGTHGGSIAAQVSILPYLTALLRYTQHASAGQGGEPEEIVLKDKIILANGAAWVACIAVSFLLHGAA